MPEDPSPTVVYPFKLLNVRSGKWRLARWKASLEEVEKLGGEVCGPGVTYAARGSTSDYLQGVAIKPHCDGNRLEMHPHWDSPPAIDPLEQIMVRTFLRRYATWCVRTRRYAEAQGAAALHLELSRICCH